MQGLAQVAHLLGRTMLFPDVDCAETPWVFDTGKPTGKVPFPDLNRHWFPYGKHMVGRGDHLKRHCCPIHVCAVVCAVDQDRSRLLHFIVIAQAMHSIARYLPVRTSFAIELIDICIPINC